MSAAPFTMASPRGCSELFSADAVNCKSLSSSMLAAITSVTSGFPSVIVPVLSKMMVWILWVVSRASPPFMRIPFSAPLPVPTMMAVGVASPKAHGQAMTRTEIKVLMAKAKL